MGVAETSSPPGESEGLPGAGEGFSRDKGSGDELLVGDSFKAGDDWTEEERKSFIIWQEGSVGQVNKADFTRYSDACDKKVGNILEKVQHGLNGLQRLADFEGDNPCFNWKEFLGEVYGGLEECEKWGEANIMVREFVFGGLKLIDSLQKGCKKTGEDVEGRWRQ